MFSRLFLLALLVAASGLSLSESTPSAIYPDPPAANVTAHNLAIAAGLNDSFDPARQAGGTVQMDFYGTDTNGAPLSKRIEPQLINASATILALDPSVGNATSASSSPVAMFSCGALEKSLASADYEGDGCTERQVSSSHFRTARLDFSFGNETESVQADGNAVPVPQRILLAMGNASGADALSEIGRAHV
jgi:hypothetical protein